MATEPTISRHGRPSTDDTMYFSGLVSKCGNPNLVDPALAKLQLAYM
jgi:hypothetical protein